MLPLIARVALATRVASRCAPRDWRATPRTTGRRGRAINTTSAADTVRFAFTVTDDLAGINFANIDFINPSRTQTGGCAASGGGALSGVFECVASWPAFSEP